MDLLRADPALAAVIPAAKPPPGVTPDFEDAIKHGKHKVVLGVMLMFIGMCTLIIALRLFTRVILMRIFDWTDVFAVLGHAFAVAFMTMAIRVDSVRLGRHMWEISAKDFLLSLMNIASILYAPATAFLKVSILLLFLQVFVPRRGSVVWWLNISLIVTNCLTYFALMIVMIFECVPRAKITQPYLDGRCINGYDVYLTNASFNSVSDFFILIYPLWAIWKLQMPNNRKLASSVAFLTGVFALVASLVRLQLIHSVSQQDDLAWIIMLFGVWSGAELTAVTLCSSFPFLLKFSRLTKRRAKMVSLPSTGGEKPTDRPSRPGQDEEDTMGTATRIDIRDLAQFSVPEENTTR